MASVREVSARLGGKTGTMRDGGQRRRALDLGHQRLRLGGRLHVVVFRQQVPQRLVDSERPRHVAGGEAGPHQPPAGLLVGRIDIEQCLGELALLRRSLGCGLQSRFQRVLQAVAQHVALGDQPDAERRVDFLEADEQLLGKMLPFQQQRMHPAGPDRRQHVVHVDVDGVGPEADLVRPED